MAYITHKVYVSKTNEEMEFSQEDNEKMMKLLAEYPIGYFINEESEEWVKANMRDFILIKGDMPRAGEIYEIAVAFHDKAEAARFKLTWA